jgi:hypothetical protein
MGITEMEPLMVIEQWTDKDRRGSDPDNVSRQSWSEDFVTHVQN